MENQVMKGVMRLVIICSVAAITANILMIFG
jgi:hypothetical protein